MAIKFKGDWDNLQAYLKPEEIDPRKAEVFRAIKRINMETNGYLPGDNTKRLEARIPDELLYNYCGFHGINPNTRWDWIIQKDNLNKFLADFPVCKMVDDEIGSFNR